MLVYLPAQPIPPNPVSLSPPRSRRSTSQPTRLRREKTPLYYPFITPLCNDNKLAVYPSQSINPPFQIAIHPFILSFRVPDLNSHLPSLANQSPFPAPIRACLPSRCPIRKTLSFQTHSFSCSSQRLKPRPPPPGAVPWSAAVPFCSVLWPLSRPLPVAQPNSHAQLPSPTLTHQGARVCYYHIITLEMADVVRPDLQAHPPPPFPSPVLVPAAVPVPVLVPVPVAVPPTATSAPPPSSTQAAFRAHPHLWPHLVVQPHTDGIADSSSHITENEGISDSVSLHAQGS